MSETIFITKQHLSKWQEAYYRVIIYIAIAVLPGIIAEFKGYPQFSDITPVNWVCILLTAVLQACTVVRAFLDKTVTNIKQQQNTV